MLDKILMAARKAADDSNVRAHVEHDSTFTDLVELFRLVDDYFNPGRSPSSCHSCDAPLVWVKTGRGKKPLDAAWVSGTDDQGIPRRIRLSHRDTCPQSASHKRS